MSAPIKGGDGTPFSHYFSRKAIETDTGSDEGKSWVQRAVLSACDGKGASPEEAKKLAHHIFSHLFEHKNIILRIFSRLFFKPKTPYKYQPLIDALTQFLFHLRDQETPLATLRADLAELSKTPMYQAFCMKIGEKELLEDPRRLLEIGFNLETAVEDGKVMQDFESESPTTGGEHSQKVKAPPVVGDYGSKDCVNLPSSTAVSRFKETLLIETFLNVLDRVKKKGSPVDLQQEFSRLAKEASIFLTRPALLHLGKLEEEVYEQLATEFVENLPRETFIFLKPFLERIQKIEDERYRIAIARKMVREAPYLLAADIQRFRIQDQRALIEIAKSIAKGSRIIFSSYIANFGIQDQGALIEIAEIEVQKDPRTISRKIAAFNIQSQTALVKIAKIAAQKGLIWEEIDAYHIQDPKALLEIKFLTLQHVVGDVRGLQWLQEQKEWISESSKRLQKNEYCWKMIQDFDIKIEKETNPIQQEVLRGQRLRKMFLLDYALFLLKDVKITEEIYPILEKIVNYRNMSIARSLIEVFCKKIAFWDMPRYLHLVSSGAHLILPMIFVAALDPLDSLTHFRAFLASQREALRDAATGKMATLLNTLRPLYEDPHLLPHQKRAWLEGIAAGPSLEVYDRLGFIQTLYAFNCGDKLTEPFTTTKELSARVMAALEGTGVLDLQGIEHFGPRYLATFGHLRFPNALFIYMSRLSTLKDPSLVPSLSRFVKGVLEGTYEQDRLAKNPHLDAIEKARPGLLALWTQAVPPVPLQAEGKREGTAFSFEQYLKQKILEDHHAEREGKELFPGLIQVLQGGTLPSDATDAEKLCVQLLSLPLENHLSLLEKLRDLLPDCQFKGDIARLCEQLRQPAMKKTDLNVVATHDWQDILLSGTEVVGSCQSIYAEPNLNKCLLGYADGKIEMLAVKDREGKILARCFLKLLLDPSGQPVLFQERIYPQPCPPDMERALNALADRRKVQLALPLATKNKRPGLTSKIVDLQSLRNGYAPYEYEDGGARVSNGTYRIQGTIVET